MRLLRSSRFLVACGLVMLFIIGTMVGAERSASTMASAANHFLASLTPDQRAQAVFDFHSDERVKFHFIPMEQFPRNGLTIGAMTDAQRAHAHDLLSAGLSQRGYLTATTIMDLETILSALEPDGRFDRNSELYFFSVFGTPSSEGAWGWRVEGHHVSLHFTIVDGTAVASAPSFLGANPAQVRSGPKAGLRALREHEDAGRALVKALDPSQRDAAVILARLSSLSSRLYDSGSVAELTVDPISPVGVKAAALNPRSTCVAHGRHPLLHLAHGRRHRGGADGEDPRRRCRRDRVRVGGADRSGRAALLPHPRTDLLDRVRQHARRWQPHPLGVAGLHR